MSRTYRNLEGMSHCALRRPRTFNEIRQLDGILYDEDLNEYNVSGMNHIRSREHQLPTHWDDIIVSGYYQQDWDT